MRWIQRESDVDVRFVFVPRLGRRSTPFGSRAGGSRSRSATGLSRHGRRVHAGLRGQVDRIEPDRGAAFALRKDFTALAGDGLGRGFPSLL